MASSETEGPQWEHEPDDELDWDLEERDRFMAEHDGEEGIEPEVEVLVRTDE